MKKENNIFSSYLFSVLIILLLISSIMMILKMKDSTYRRKIAWIDSMRIELALTLGQDQKDNLYEIFRNGFSQYSFDDEANISILDELKIGLNRQEFRADNKSLESWYLETDSLLVKLYENFNQKIRYISLAFSSLFIFLILIIILIFFLINISLRTQMRENAYLDLSEFYERKMIYQLEQERSLVAYHLHDEIAQSLVFIKTYLESRNPDFIERKKKKALSLTNEVLNSIRNLSHALRAPSLKEGDFNSTLKVLCEDMNGLTPIELHYNFLGTADIELKEDQFLHIYRITQELLNNGIKHSKGKRIDIRFLCSFPHLIIQYSDDGVGFNSEEKKSASNSGSLGITGIEYRCQLLKASIHFQLENVKGTHIRLEIPLEIGDEANSYY